MWVHLSEKRGGLLLYESGSLDSDGNLADGVAGHSIDPYSDPISFCSDSLYWRKWRTRHIHMEVIHADNGAPGQRAWRDYPLLRGLNEDLTVTATLKYRTFPPSSCKRLPMKAI